MNQIPTVSVLLPTYNEKDNLPHIVNSLTKCMKDISHEIIIVDDNSPDGTLEVAKKLQTTYSSIVLAPRSAKLGLGTAYMHGIQFAKADKIVIMDADLSHDPACIPDFFKMMTDLKIDIVSGTRYADGGIIYGWSWKRKDFVRSKCFRQILAQHSIF